MLHFLFFLDETYNIMDLGKYLEKSKKPKFRNEENKIHSLKDITSRKER